MKKRALIIGVHGFIGRSLKSYLSALPQVEVLGIGLKPSPEKNVFSIDVNNTAPIFPALVFMCLSLTCYHRNSKKYKQLLSIKSKVLKYVKTEYRGY